VREGFFTSCDAPTGPYAFFAATVLQPACTKVMHPSAPPGAARCALLAADAFDRGFTLRKRLGVYPATAAADVSAGAGK
jgi:hypothetical protein